MQFFGGIIPGLLGLTWLLIGCGEANFVSKGGRDNLKDSADETRANNTDPLTDEADKIPYGKCPSTAQNILVIDLKSGWWAGDGGDFFNKILSELTARCESTIKIEYHHIIITGVDIPPISKSTISNTMMVFPDFQGEQKMPKEFPGAFLETDWQKYSQVWLLSGSHADPADLKTSNEFFAEILAKVAASDANLLIGAGYGSITHSNALLEKLTLTTRFATNLPEGLILDPTQDVAELSELTVGQELLDFHLFTDLNQVSDNMQIGDQTAKGDYLTAKGDVAVVGKNTEGADSIAVSSFNERRIVLDAGLQRYYSIFADLSPGTLMLIRNIISYLSI